MIKNILTCLLFWLIYSCSYSQKNSDKNKKDTTFYKTTLVPLKVTQPPIVTKNQSIDSSYLNLFISKDSIVVELFSNVTTLDNGNSLDKFLISNKEKIDRTKVLVINEKDGSVEKFKEVVAALSKNGITKFSVVSR
jgi:agmatine/peptidylarginine deiminase